LGHGVVSRARAVLVALVSVIVAASALVAVIDLGSRAGTARAIAPLDPDEEIDFSLVLAHRNTAALERAATDPIAHLTAAEVGRRFGISDEDLGTVLDVSRAAGFDVVATYPQRTAVRLRGTVAEIASAFGTRVVEFEQPTGRRYRAPVPAPVVPAELRPFVTAVAGLDTAAIPTFSAAAPALSTVFDIPPDGLTPAQAATAYGITPLHDAGFTGQGQTIALYSGATFDPADVERFDELFGIESPPVERIPVNGGTDDTSSPLAGEVALDVDVIRGLAPDAQILNYEVDLASSPDISSFPQSIADVVDQIVADGRADIVSISYGITDTADHCGQSWLTPEDRLRGEQALQAAAAAGIAIFVSSGDQGAYASQHFDPSCVRKSVTWPGSSPWVTSVGGTLLSVASDGGYLEESGWEDVLWHWGTGGGTNPIDARPTWQVAPGVDNAFSDGKRQVPDVAATADPDSGPITVFAGQTARSGGTSAAAPFWAASWLLIGQYLESNGAALPGFANPTLYRLASTPQAFAPYHDVVRGGNRLRNCTPGWDYATGLGSPDVWNIARDLLARSTTG
jgi:subtilase family serine protease